MFQCDEVLIKLRKLNTHKKCGALNLVDEQCFPGNRAFQFGDTYFITYSGKKCELNRHLKGSNIRDRQKGFRLYFFWDDDTKQVIVGSLPEHLTTQAS